MNEENNTEIKVNDRRGQDRPEEKKPEAKAAPKQAEPQAKEAPKSDEKKQTYKGSIDFSNFILSLSTSAAIYMGLIEDPSTGIIQKNLTHARQQIDLIEMLYFKTQGNLTPEEKKLFDQVLYELKVRFVEASKQPV